MQSHARTMQNLTMQRRHFQLIAETLRDERPERDGTAWANGARDEWSTIVLRFANRLAGTNGNFNRAAFLAACGME